MYKVGDFIQTECVLGGVKYGFRPGDTTRDKQARGFNSVIEFIGVFPIIKVKSDSVIIDTLYDKVSFRSYGINGWYYDTKNHRLDTTSNTVAIALSFKRITLFEGQVCHKCKTNCQQTCQIPGGLVTIIK